MDCFFLIDPLFSVFPFLILRFLSFPSAEFFSSLLLAQFGFAAGIKFFLRFYITEHFAHPLREKDKLGRKEEQKREEHLRYAPDMEDDGDVERDGQKEDEQHTAKFVLVFLGAGARIILAEQGKEDGAAAECQKNALTPQKDCKQAPQCHGCGGDSGCKRVDGEFCLLAEEEQGEEIERKERPYDERHGEVGR